MFDVFKVHIYLYKLTINATRLSVSRWR